MASIYACATCGVVTVEPAQLCRPVEQADAADYCGNAPARDTMCQPMREHLTYVCGSCGRPGEQAELLCRPLLLG